MATQKALVCLIAILCLGVLVSGSGEECLEGPFHRKTSGASSKQFAECLPWQSDSCCTPEFTESLKNHEAIKLYNFTWHTCGQLSAQCQSFWVKEECFYQCSPYLKQWQHPQIKGVAKGVPMCSKFCDRWYEACKSDMICVENVLTDYNFTSAGHNYCPSTKPCITYEKMYGSGAALCDKMWGESFIYTKENKDQSNCMAMWFGEGDANPNANVKRAAVSGAAEGTASLLSVVVALFVAFM